MIIPKDELPNYQRWQAGSFDQKATPATPPPVSASPAPMTPPAPAEMPPAVKLPTADDIERMHEEARALGYAAGLQEGREMAAQQASEAAGQFAQRYATLLGNLQQALDEVDQSVADQLLALAVEIAAQVARSTIAVRSDALLPIVREAIAALPLHHAHVTLRLNPADATDIRTLLGDEFTHSGTQVVEDPTISIGGCQIQAGTSEIDASIETRWKRVLEVIGTEPRAWQNP